MCEVSIESAWMELLSLHNMDNNIMVNDFEQGDSNILNSPSESYKNSNQCINSELVFCW